MPFDTRCPECKANLTLDAAPAAGAPVECPRCGSTFVPPKAKKKDQPAADKPKPPGVPKKKKAKKKKTNPIILLLAIGFGFAGLAGVGFAMVYFLSRSGKVEEMLATVPAECNWARGVNVAQLAKYPGYNQEVAKYMGGEVGAAVQDLAKAARGNPDTFVDYLIIAKNRPGAGAVYVLKTIKPFVPDQLAKTLGGTGQAGSGYRIPPSANGILAGAVMFVPTNRLIVIVPPGGSQDGLARGVAAAVGSKDKKGTFAGNLNDTGWMVVRGSIWLLVRATGGLKNYPSALVAGVDTDFKNIHDAAKGATAFGLWTTPGGGGVRFGAALECGSPKDATALVDSMKNGPLGKGDESEPTTQLKAAAAFVTDKKLWTEMMQQMSYRSKGSCAYLVTTLTDDRAKNVMTRFNDPELAANDTFATPGRGG